MKKSATEAALRVSTYFCVGEEAIRKGKTIAGWMEKDRRSDSLEENAVAPTGIECLHCGKSMESTFKTLDYNERVLFFYDCPNNCVPRRCFYDNGEEWLRKPDPCTKCGADTKNKTVRKGKTITTTLTCTACKHTSSSSFEMGKEEKIPIDPLFEEDRARFCLNQTELDKYISEKRNLEELSAFVKKYEDSDKMKKIDVFLKDIKTLNLAGLKLLMQQSLKKAGFGELVTSDPSKGYRGISINFTAQDTRTDRDERSAKKAFKESAIVALQVTNWRLLESTIEASLGLITGRIKGYQNQSELREVVEKEVEEGKIDIKSIESKYHQDQKPFEGITL